MALFKATQVVNKMPLINADGYEPITLVGDYTLSGSEATGDVIEMVGLPANYVVVDAIADTDDMGATATADCGFLSGNYNDTGARTCGATIMAAQAFGTAGVYRASVTGFARQAPTTNDRGIGFNLSSVLTPTASAKVRLTVIARPQLEGV